MSLEAGLFAALAAVTVAAALMTALTTHIVRAAAWLLLALAGVAGLYFLLAAPFVGAAQLIVYVGGVMVLVVFGVMLTARESQVRLPGSAGARAAALVVGAAVALPVILALPAGTPAPSGAPTTPAELGKSLTGLTQPGRTHFLLPFEAASVHLLVVLVAAAYLARPRVVAIAPDGEL